MKRVLIPILLLVLLLGGCAQNGTDVEELQSRIAQLEQESTALRRRINELEEQLGEKGAGQNKNEAIADFAEEALKLEDAFGDVVRKWHEWWEQNTKEMDHDNPPSYLTRVKEIEAYDKAVLLWNEVRSLTATIDQLYAPPDALEIKRRILSHGSLLVQAFADICNYLAEPDSHSSSLYIEAEQFISRGSDEIYTDIRLELTDLLLEYGQ